MPSMCGICVPLSTYIHYYKDEPNLGIDILYTDGTCMGNISVWPRIIVEIQVGSCQVAPASEIGSWKPFWILRRGIFAQNQPQYGVCHVMLYLTHTYSHVAQHHMNAYNHVSEHVHTYNDIGQRSIATHSIYIALNTSQFLTLIRDVQLTQRK